MGTVPVKVRFRLLSGSALEVRDLVGLAIGLLLGVGELVLRFALALLLAPLVAQAGVVGEVSRRLLGASGDFVREAHVLGVPSPGRAQASRSARRPSAT